VKKEKLDQNLEIHSIPVIDKINKYRLVAVIDSAKTFSQTDVISNIIILRFSA